MMRKYYIPFLVLPLQFLILTNCNMNGQSNNYGEYKELHEHPGTENYEVVSILDPEYLIRQTSLDRDQQQLIVNTKTSPIKEEETEYKRLKVSATGRLIDEGPIYTLLKDGTLWYTDHYNNWIINGDTTKYKFKDPLAAEEKKDFDRWFEKFKELYTRASYVYIDISDYYLKVDKEWYIIADTLEERPPNLRKLFPPKEDQQIRMVELEDLSPAYYAPPEERDHSLIREIDYESVYSEEINRGWDSHTYSAGWWYLQIYMPGGDTLRIKRYSDIRNPRMKLYKIPERYGGREDVLFMVLEPKDAHFEQVGGMYVVRPRKLGRE